MFTIQDLISSPVTSTLRPLVDELLEKKYVSINVLIDETGPLALRGNKWHKLKYNLLEAGRLQKNTLLTFGGAYSNHIAATALASKIYKFKSIGIIRGEETLPLNKTLQEAKDNGMQLHYETRENYRKKENPDYQDELKNRFGDFYLIPEGGSNYFAIQGCRELVQSIKIPFDYICCPYGTGATFAGLITGLKENQKALAFNVLKTGDFLKGQIDELLEQQYIERNNWTILNNYHFGGYAKTTKDLIDFTNLFEQKHQIKIEPIYTGKMFYGLYDLIRNDFFERGSDILAYHTGGLQYLNLKSLEGYEG